MVKFEDLNLPVYKGSELFICPNCDYSIRGGGDTKSCRHCKQPMKPIEDDIKWNWEAEKIFLTYPKSHDYLTPTLLIEKIKDRLADKAHFPKKAHALDRYLVTREKHKDGTWHLHGFFQFERKLRTKNNKLFDVHVEHTPNVYKEHHPNWSKPRNVYKVWDYIMKEGHYNHETGIGYVASSNFDFVLPELRALEESASYEEFARKMVTFTDGYWRHFYLNKLAVKKFLDLGEEDPWFISKRERQ